MAEAPTNNGTTGTDGGAGGGTTTPPAPATTTTPPAGGSAEFDPTALSQEQINQVLEKNPHIWQADRIAELRAKAKKHDDAQAAAEAAETKRLEDEGKFKDLSEKQKAQIENLQTQVSNSTINQALTNKLAPLGVVDLEAALALVNRSNIKVDDNGTVSGVDEAIESLKTGKAYLFGTPGTSTVGNATNPGNGSQQGGPAKFKRSQLRDPAFYNENREEIRKAAAAGLIEDDIGTGK